MLDNIHQLHPRGLTNRGICVDRDGAMLGPDCILVTRTLHGFQGIDRRPASLVQKCVFGAERDDDWLFWQCQRIADSLEKGEVALAQIYGLRIPVRYLDDRVLKRLAADGFTKWTFNPDEPRVPKGDPHGGEWTAGDETVGAAPSVDISPPTDDGDQGSGDVSPVYQLDTASSDEPSATTTGAGDGGEGSSAGSSTTPSSLGNGSQLAPLAAAFVGDEAGWLLGELAPATAGALARLMTGLTGAGIVFGILFIPTNRSLVSDGPVAGAPDLSYRYDSGMGVLQIRQDVGSLGSVVLDEAHKGTDDLFRDAQGNVIGRYLSGSGVVVDVGALPGYRMLPGGDLDLDAGAQQQNEPKLCPDPTPDRPGAPLDNPYQQYVSMLINGRALPPGLAVSLFNPISGKNVAFDDCRLSDGTMIDAKGDGYLEMLLKGSESMPWIGVQDKLVTQANSQLQAAQGRPIEWYFKAQPVADFVRELFEQQDLRITVIYAPQRE
jgi:hypothetical protein